MSNNETGVRVFELQQHTPMLHFQHNHPEAALRATEIMPKLERLIKGDLEKIDPELCKRHRVSLNRYFGEKPLGRFYKMFVTSKIEEKKDVKTYWGKNDTTPDNQRLTGSYFGDKHKAVIFGKISIRIVSLDDDLNDLVFEALKWLFLKENFGCRVTKGFGSFTWKGWNEQEIQQKMKQIQPCFESALYKNVPPEKSLLNIHQDYQLMKSGRNYPYVRSEIFLFMCANKSIGWEKRKIKREVQAYNNTIDKKDRILLLSNKPPIRCHDLRPDWNEHEKNVSYKFIRALLGLAEQYEYLLESFPNEKKKKMVVGIAHTKNEIQRYASPIKFKVIHGIVYMLCEKVNPEMFDKEFEFKIRLKESKKDLFATKMHTPSASEFDIKKFTEQVFTKLEYTKL